MISVIDRNDLEDPFLIIRGPNLFFKYFISFLGLAYFSSLGCSLRFDFFLQFSATTDPFLLQ